MLAVEGGHAKCTEILLGRQDSVDSGDANGRTALHRAACRGFEDCVALLLAVKASPFKKDVLGKTPLHLAAAMGYVCVLKQLAQNGDPPTAYSLQDLQNYTPLHWAAYKSIILLNFSLLFFMNSRSTCSFSTFRLRKLR